MRYLSNRLARCLALFAILITVYLASGSVSSAKKPFVSKTKSPLPTATITITSPANGAVFNFPNTISINANNQTTNSFIYYVNFYANGSLIGAKSSQPYTLNWVDGTPGIYALTAEAVEVNGARTISEPINITINGNCSPSWSVFTAPPSAGFGDRLTGIDALSTNEIWATGAYSNSNGIDRLAMKWDGARWVTTPIPSQPGAPTEYFTHIKAISSRNVWAFGNQSSTPTSYQWDGNAWRNVPFNIFNGFFNPRIGGVSASAADNLWVVGGDDAIMWTARWDGFNWTRIPMPIIHARLHGVAALSKNDVWAVGGGDNIVSSADVEILHWDGSQWNIVASKRNDNGGGSIAFGSLSAISARAANDIWAVGGEIAMHWDGRQWSEFLLPLASVGGRVNKVLTLAPDDAWAVGADGNKALAYHWDGERWSVIYAPQAEGGIQQEFFDITASSATDVWAVGTTGTGTPLVQRLTPACSSGVALSFLTTDRTNTIGGETVQGTINLTEPAPTGGVTVAISSSNPLVTTLGTLTIPTGASRANFEINTAPSITGGEAVITVSLGGMKQRARILLKPTLLTSLEFDPPRIVNGGSTRMIVSLNGPAPATGSSIRLANFSPELLNIPALLDIPAGQTSVSLALGNIAYRDGTNYSVNAGSNNSQVTGTLAVSPTLELRYLYVGNPDNSEVFLTGPAPVGGIIVTLESSDTSLVTVPASVLIPEGQWKTTFSATVRPSAGPAPTRVFITARWNGSQQRAYLDVLDYSVVSFQLDKQTVYAGQSVQGTFTINKPAGAGGQYVYILSSNRNVVFPASRFIIPWGQTSTRTTILALPVSKPETIKLNGETLTVLPALKPSLSFDSAIIASGETTRGIVTLSAPAPEGGAVVNLFNSNLAQALPPQTVTIPEGSTTATFNIKANNVASQTQAIIWASYLGIASRAKLTLIPIGVASFTIEPASVFGTQSAQATVTLTGPLPLAPYVLTITSSNPSVVSVPQNVQIERGASSVSFNISTTAVSQPTTVTLSASYTGLTKTATLTVAPDIVTITSLSYSSFRRQLRVEARSTSATASMGVYYTSNNRLIGYLANNGGGRYTATFDVATNPQSVTVKSNFGGSAVGSLTGAPPPPTPAVTLSTLVIEPNTVNNGNSAQGTVTLSDLAAPGNAVVTLSSNNPAAVVEDSVIVPAGANNAAFTIITRTVTEPTVVTISASLGAVTRTGTLTVLPVVQAGDAVVIQAASYDFFRKQLKVQATSTNQTARLQVFITANDQLIGTLTSVGSGRFSGQFFVASNPQNITVRSSLGGAATQIVR